MIIFFFCTGRTGLRRFLPIRRKHFLVVFHSFIDFGFNKFSVCDPRSYDLSLSNSKKGMKNWGLNGTRTLTFAMPMQCSSIWAVRPEIPRSLRVSRVHMYFSRSFFLPPKLETGLKSFLFLYCFNFFVLGRGRRRLIGLRRPQILKRPKGLILPPPRAKGLIMPPFLRRKRRRYLKFRRRNMRKRRRRRRKRRRRRRRKRRKYL